MVSPTNTPPNKRNNIMNNKVATKTLTTEQIEKSVSVLNRAFREAADEFKSRTGITSNVRGTALNEYQTEFAYVIHEIQKGPVFFVIQRIAEANDLISKMSKHQKEVKAAA